ncbi:hypothetical protein EH223_18905 [candidate division KSB1 bacterium]|nr:hypothetical protein [candidate division KSB1 bacterium]RQW00373.1 MAG: hypothetical protein EH223_18905 [candidate division KSB1 bacterium]
MSGNGIELKWRRLEPFKPKDTDPEYSHHIEKSLRAEIRDPLWMLGRQWQFGEFKADNAGTPAEVSYKIQTAPITHYGSIDDKIQDFKNINNFPPEYYVEQESESDYSSKPLDLIDLKRRVEMGLELESLLNPNSEGDENNQNVTDIKELQRIFSFASVDIDELDSASLYFLNSVKNRVIDGGEIFLKLQNGNGGEIPQALFNRHREIFNEFYKWAQKNYGALQQRSLYWRDNQLEYQFALASKKNGDEIVLQADEYYEGDPDWYSFIVKSSILESQGAVKTSIPTPCEFPGMPNSRWWECEENKIDFGNLAVGEDDIAKLLLMEFALLHSNDWFILPIEMAFGTLCRITKLDVTDVFGDITTVKEAPSGDLKNWANSWSMFKLAAGAKSSSLFFLPPTFAHVEESESIEKVTFLRDEMANLVWAVEQTLPNGIGEATSGYELYREKLARRQNNDKRKAANSDSIPEYKLMSTVPHNWIPFIPMHKDENQREIIFSKGYIEDEDGQEIKPRGMILSANNLQINEEEITRSGLTITRTYQRARWIDGKTYQWIGRRKRPGRGEGASGLRFDYLE